MLTRREFMVGAVAAGVILRTQTVFAKASQPATPVNFDVPPGACDCHTHCAIGSGSHDKRLT